MILIIDNYDSFTYNLVQYTGEFGANVVVRRNDAITTSEIGRLRPSRIIISPGPGTPDQAGVTLATIAAFGRTIPILGVCLGHQAIGQVFGARVFHAPTLMHGKTSEVYHDGGGLHAGVPSPFRATRYHSLALEPASIPGELRVTAWTSDGDVMGIQHRDYPLYGLQYHPESYMTPHGRDILNAFLRRTSIEPHQAWAETLTLIDGTTRETDA